MNPSPLLGRSAPPAPYSNPRRLDHVLVGIGGRLPDDAKEPTPTEGDGDEGGEEHEQITSSAWVRGPNRTWPWGLASDGWPHATERGKLILKQAMAGVAGVLPTGRGA